MIGGMFDAVFEGTVDRLGGLLQTAAPYIIEPAMVAAADAILFDPSVFQRSAPMAAVKRQNAELAGAIAKQHELFRQQPNFDRRGFWFHFLAECHRPPVTSQHLPGRLPRTNSGQKFVLFF